MRLKLLPWLMLVCAAPHSALAQDPRSAEASARAPLAAIDDLEPAVDVGGVEPGPSASSVTALSALPTAPDAARGAAAPAAIAATAATGSAAALRQRTADAMDTLDLGTTSITGNQELPKVLYIVPWKKSDLGELVGRPVNTLLDEVLAPVDPEVFERQLDYYETLNSVSEEE